MSKFSPYAALCNIFRNSEAPEQPESQETTENLSEKQVNTKNLAATLDPKKISMINNSCQTQPLRDYSIDKVIPNYKDRQETAPKPLGFRHSSKDDNFRILRPSYAAFTGEKPYIELRKNIRPPRRPKVPRTPKTPIPRRTITPPKPAPQIEIAYNPLVNTRGSTNTNKLKPRHIITVTDRSTVASNPNTRRNQRINSNSTRNLQDVLRNHQHQQQPIPLEHDYYNVVRNPNVNAVYRTISTLREALQNGKLCIDPEVYDKCTCQDCNTLAVLSESLKHPISYDNPGPYENTNNEKSINGQAHEKIPFNSKRHRSRTRVMAEAYSILEGKLELLEQRLQELEVFCQHYDKINENHSGLTFDIYTQCTYEDGGNCRLNYENSELTIKESPNYEVNFDSSEVNVKACNFPLFHLPRNIADKFKKNFPKQKRSQVVNTCPQHLVERSVYTCSTVDQNYTPTNDPRNNKPEEKPKLRSQEYLHHKRKQENANAFKSHSSKLNTASKVNFLDEKLDNFDFNLFTEQEVRDLLMYIRERNTNKKACFEQSSRKQASTEVLFSNKKDQAIMESTPNFILEEATGHLEHFDEVSATTFQDLPTDSFQEPSQQNIFLDSRIGDQHDPFDYFRFLNTKLQEKIYNENSNLNTKKSYTPGIKVMHNTKQFFRRNESVTLDKNNSINLHHDSETNNMQLRGTKLRLNSHNGNNHFNLLQATDTDNIQLRGTKIKLNTHNKSSSNNANLLQDNHQSNLLLQGTKLNLQSHTKKLCKNDSLDIDSMMYKLNEEISYLFDRFHNARSDSKHSTKINTVYTNSKLNSNTTSNASTFYSEFELPEKLSRCNLATSRTSADVQFSSFEAENENFNLTKNTRASTDFTYFPSSEEPKFVPEVTENTCVTANLTQYVDSEETKLVTDSSTTANTEIFTPKTNLLETLEGNTVNTFQDEKKIRPIQTNLQPKQDISSSSKKVAKPYVSKIPKAIHPKVTRIVVNNSESTKTEEEPISNATTTSKSLNTSENKTKSCNKTQFKAPSLKKPVMPNNQTFVRDNKNSKVKDKTSNEPQVKTKQQLEAKNEESQKKLKILNKFALNSKFKPKPRSPITSFQQKKVLNKNKTSKLESPEEQKISPKAVQQKIEKIKEEPQQVKKKFVKKIKKTLSKNFISSKTSVRKFFRKAKSSKIFRKSKIPIRSTNRPVPNNATLEEKETNADEKELFCRKRIPSKSNNVNSTFISEEQNTKSNNDNIVVISNEQIIKSNNDNIAVISNEHNTKSNNYNIAVISEEQNIKSNNDNIAVISNEQNTAFEIIKRGDSENYVFEIASIEQFVNINCVMFTIDTMLLNTILPFEYSSDEEPTFTEVASIKSVHSSEIKPHEKNREILDNKMVLCNKRIPPRQNVVLTVQTVILNNIAPKVEKDDVCLFPNLHSAMNILLYRRSSHSDLSSSDTEYNRDLMSVNQGCNNRNFVILNMSKSSFNQPHYDYGGIPADIRKSIDDLLVPYSIPSCECTSEFSFEDLHTDDSSDSFTAKVMRRPPSLVKRLKNMFVNAFRRTDVDRRRSHCGDRSCNISIDEAYYINTRGSKRHGSYRKSSKKSAFRSIKDYVGAKVFHLRPGRRPHRSRPTSFMVVPLVRPGPSPSPSVSPSHGNCSCCSCGTRSFADESDSSESDIIEGYYEDAIVLDPRFKKPQFKKDFKSKGAKAPKPQFGKSFKPQFGKSLQPQFGKSLQPQFGKSFKPQFGKALQPQFGKSLQPQFGKSLKPQFGKSSKPQFGKSSKPQFSKEFKPPVGNALKPRVSLALNPEVAEDLERQVAEALERQAAEDLERQAVEYLERQAEEDLERQAEEDLERQAEEDLARQVAEELERQAVEDLERQAEEDLLRQAGRESVSDKRKVSSILKTSVDFNLPENRRIGLLNYCCLTREELGMDAIVSSPDSGRKSHLSTKINPGPSKNTGDIQTNKTASKRSLFTNSGFFNTRRSQSNKLVTAHSALLPNYRNSPTPNTEVSKKSGRELNNLAPENMNLLEAPKAFKQSSSLMPNPEFSQKSFIYGSDSKQFKKYRNAEPKELKLSLSPTRKSEISPIDAGNSAQFTKYRISSTPKAGLLKSPDHNPRNSSPKTERKSKKSTAGPRFSSKPDYKSFEVPQPFKRNPSPIQQPEYSQKNARAPNTSLSIDSINEFNARDAGLIAPKVNNRESRKTYEFQANPEFYESKLFEQRSSLNAGIFLREPTAYHGSQDSVYFEPDPNARNSLRPNGRRKSTVTYQI